MKFSRRSKYFLRGMGFGILVTVVLFSVALVFYNPDDDSNNSTASVTDESAKEQSFEDLNEKEEESVENTDSADANSVEESDTSDTDSVEESDASESANTKTASDTSAEPNEAPTDLVSFKVSAGESSYKVAENLYRAGLIDNPGTFNTFLEQNGYDNTIRVGTFHISKDSTYEQIANTIASK